MLEMRVAELSQAMSEFREEAFTVNDLEATVDETQAMLGDDLEASASSLETQSSPSEEDSEEDREEAEADIQSFKDKLETVRKEMMEPRSSIPSAEEAKKTMLGLYNHGVLWYQVVDGKDAIGATKHSYDNQQNGEDKYPDFYNRTERAYLFLAGKQGQHLTIDILNEANKLLIGGNGHSTGCRAEATVFFYEDMWEDTSHAASGGFACWKFREIQGLLDGFYEEVESANTRGDIMDLVMDLGFKFGTLHTFWDGNGRSKVMMMNFLLCEFGLHPLVLYNNNRDIAHAKTEAKAAQWQDRVYHGYAKWDEAMEAPDMHPWARPGESDAFQQVYPHSLGEHRDYWSGMLSSSIERMALKGLKKG